MSEIESLTPETLKAFAQEQFSRGLLSIEDVRRVDSYADAWEQDLAIARGNVRMAAAEYAAMQRAEAAEARLEAADEKLAEATWLLQHSEDEDEEGLIQVQWLDRRRDWLAALARKETPDV